MKYEDYSTRESRMGEADIEVSPLGVISVVVASAAIAYVLLKGADLIPLIIN